jgi:pilus assembly protein CpaD
MREITRNLFRGFCLTAVLMAGSCAAPGDESGPVVDDPIAAHPISVEPSYQSLKLSYSGGAMNSADSERLDAFVADYRQHGNGKISISAPSGVSMQQAVISLADQINQMGVSRDHILIATHDAAAGDDRLEVDYISYRAHADACDDWSEDLTHTWENQPPRVFGCATQHNIAAMVSDPRDLLGPRPMDEADGRRRQTVITNYDKGQPTAATKSADQSATITDVGK